MAHLALRTDLNAKQKDYVGKIQGAALSLLEIINEILDFSKIEAGRLDVEAVPFSLDEVLSNVATVTSQKAADKRLEYMFNVSPAVPRRLVGDPLRLSQVLINLVNNAIKFTEEGEIEVACSTSSAGDASQDGKAALQFSVRDTGIGMSPEQVVRLFQPFVQADGSTSRKYGGTGLGLSISQRLLELMDGRIEVESAVGQGTVFRFYLTLPLAPEQDRSEILPSTLNGARVLVVDDNAAARLALAEAMRVMPVRVDTAGSAQWALAAIRAADASRDPYRLLLTDWMMPGMDGIELIRTIRGDKSLSQAPHALLVTAFGREDIDDDARRAGAAALLQKPVNQSLLVDALIGIFLPTRQKIGPQMVSAVQSQPRYDGVHVLLAEDNSINQQIAIELLGAVGVTVDVANSGQEALDKLEAGGPRTYDLILMDLEMPGMDGHTATAHIRANPAYGRLPIVAMTAHAIAEVRERCLKAGMQDYVTKPINPNLLYAALARWVSVPFIAPPEVAAPAPSGPPLPQLPGIDVQEGLEIVGGDRELYFNLLQLFMNSQAAGVDRIRGALEAGERDTARVQAHSLRGAAANVGAQAVQDMAGRLEAALAGAVDGAELTALVDALDDAMTLAIGSLRRHFTADPAAAVAAG
jgi:CheY-like chemotaxis protein/HPt (histidine-containing phosphotransfer) domain-containing protein